MKQGIRSTLIVTTLAAMSFAAGPVLSHETGQGASGATPMHGMGMGDTHGSDRGQGYMHGKGMMRNMQGHGMMNGSGMMGGMFEKFDGDGDGVVSPDEMREGFAARMREFDSDGDGTLTLEEFEAFHAAMIRNMVVDHFQALDEDGDGRITAEEMDAPAKRMERLQRMKERSRDSQMQGGGQHGTGDGGMMNDN